MATRIKSLNQTIEQSRELLRKAEKLHAKVDKAHHDAHDAHLRAEEFRKKVDARQGPGTYELAGPSRLSICATIRRGIFMGRAAASPVSRDVLPQIRHIVAIGASAGGLHSIFAVLEPLPADLDCCITIATHLSETHNSILPELLARRAKLSVVAADDQLALRNATVFVARPRFHLAVEADRLSLSSKPPIHFLRPNIDVLFESVARQFGNRAVGVILSGTGNDGAQGMRAIKDAGGITIIEDPTFAEFADMPIASNRTGCVDFVLPLNQISARLIEICAMSS